MKDMIPLEKIFQRTYFEVGNGKKIQGKIDFPYTIFASDFMFFVTDACIS
jgi:hypothetical protein